MSESELASVAPAKGRPMLTWVGKRPISGVRAFPAQLVETYHSGDHLEHGQEWGDWPSHFPQGGLLFHGDNKEVLAHLLTNGFRGKINLACIDPPFDSGADYVRKVRLRGGAGNGPMGGANYSLGEQVQYTDIWANDNYLQFMYERLMLLRELLAPDGGFWIHTDWHKTHHLRFLCDEVFGPANFVDEIIWCYGSPSGGRAGGTKFVKNHDTLLHYAKDYSARIEHRIYLPYSDKYISDWFKYTDDDGRQYRRRMRGRDDKGEPVWERQYLDESKGVPAPTVWTDILSVYADPRAFKGNTPSELDYQYPTQKPEALLARIIQASTNVGDIVLDCFIGSGTTAAAAQKLGRRWIGCDINKGAIQTVSRRLQNIIHSQSMSLHEPVPDTQNEDAEAVPGPAQLSFTVWRVNDYDLQIQHNEAVNLACEHVGIERTHSDSFFDGLLGKSLVKVVPFNHPLSPLDLDEIRRELEARPDEDRNITVVALGKELAADAWLKDWNRMRSGMGAANRIDVIELRTDPKYGTFFEHIPATGKVSVTRAEERIQVEIVDFASPTIIERLKQQQGVLTPEITDWRAMVECVLIDPSYDGSVFNIGLSDVPAKRDDLVAGAYELPAPEGPATVAVKIIDMLGEEVLVTVEV